MRIVNKILPCLTAVVIYVLNVAIAFAVAIYCGSRPVNGMSFTWLVLVFMVGICIVGRGTAQCLFGQILITVSATALFSASVYDPLYFRVGYPGGNVSESVYTFANTLQTTSVILLVFYSALCLLTARKGIPNKRVRVRPWVFCVCGAQLWPLFSPDYSSSDKVFLLIVMASILASFFLTISMVRNYDKSRRYVCAIYYGYEQFVVAALAGVVVTSIRNIII